MGDKDIDIHMHRYSNIKTDRYNEIYYKELAHKIMEAESPKICSWQTGDPGEPMVWYTYLYSRVFLCVCLSVSISSFLVSE